MPFPGFDVGTGNAGLTLSVVIPDLFKLSAPLEPRVSFFGSPPRADAFNVGRIAAARSVPLENHFRKEPELGGLYRPFSEANLKESLYVNHEQRTP